MQALSVQKQVLQMDNFNWWEADQLAIYKRGQGNKTWDYRVTNLTT